MRGHTTLDAGINNICIGKDTLSKILSNSAGVNNRNTIIGHEAVSVGTAG